MDRLAYVAMTGARQTEIAQSINSNNLANVSTTGFRADLHAFSHQQIEGTGQQTRVNAIAERYATDFRQGSIISTGRDLDIAIQGEGFIAVQAPDGSEAYTRAGDLRVQSGGILTTGTGLPVIGDGGPVAIPPSANLLIGGDGTVSVQPLGQSAETTAAVDRIKLVKPDSADLVKGNDGLFRLASGDQADADAAVTVVSGSIEQSNVNVASTLVNMIELARQYEMQINVIQTARDDADTAASLLRISG
ncbi:MAG: flagellar basal-body rod protein FlgF [Pseudomonadota bacterium]